ncbi:ABC transporter substrate-binding protein [Caldovatus aquaticus]|uniref:ABC transporter substrate-binding protein n=1 Tax=Caldovatus aquaticus TaxID=2865671 RepID=A0ABS7EZM4_9PROT|nr:ABC transporter substrate-binding protein [Caldovatus aquaticus]MBW8268800.1 ABC transporter substrate-binding protein [Caldovatus aquaticus]
MFRRDLLIGAAAATAGLPRPSIAQPARGRVLKFVPQANLTSLDPIWTTAYITRNHGLMVWDTLYGVDRQFRPQPQMAEGHVFEDEGRICTITLRPGLKFHDGEPVRAADCVASLNRWMRRSPMGQKLATVVDELAAPDDRRLRFRLKRPFPLLLSALGSVNAPIPFIMPERLARTDPFQQIREAVGSGPYRFKADEFNSGSLVVYERNPDYSPTPVGQRSLLAGPKVAHFDRVEWHIIVDAATAASALQTGEIDWYEQPTPEIQQLLRRNRAIRVEPIDPLPNGAILRFNHLHPPFNDKRMRQALLPAISQEDHLVAIVGTEPGMYRMGGVFTPGTPLASEVGLEPLKGPRSTERAKALLREAGYTNQLIRLIGPTDILAPAALTQVGVDLFRRLGVNLDAVITDWGTVVQRRASREPLERGGWSVFYTAFGAYDFLDPSGHFPLRGNGAGAWFGWPTIPKLEELRDAWFEAPDLEAQKRIAEEIQRVAMDELPYVPLGAYMSMTALRSDLADRVEGPAMFWGIRRT